MRSVYSNMFMETNKNVVEDKMTGLFLIYRHFGIVLIEGSEAVLGKFINKLTAVEDKYLEASKIVAIYNNANQVIISTKDRWLHCKLNVNLFQRMFNKIISRMGEPTARKEDPNDQHLTETLDIVSKFLRTVYGLCKRINADDLDDSKTSINCI